MKRLKEKKKAGGGQQSGAEKMRFSSCASGERRDGGARMQGCCQREIHGGL